MEELNGKVAVITGGGSGIGLGIARQLGEAGCRLSLADIDHAGLDRAVETLRRDGFEVTTSVADVSKIDDVARFADNTLTAFGSVDIVINNAGVIAWNTVGALTLNDWRWVIDVNLWGVIHGLHVFLPILERQGSEGHIVNVSSIGGVLADVPFMATYSATKGAVIGLSLTLASELLMQERPVGVTILCPSGTREGQAHFAERNRPESYGPLQRRPEAQAMLDAVAATVAQGQPVTTLARRVVQAIKNNDLWCFPHPESSPMLQPRLDSLTDVLQEAGKQSVSD